MICSVLNNQDIFSTIENYEHLQVLLLADNTLHDNNKNWLINWFIIRTDYIHSCAGGAQIKG